MNETNQGMLRTAILFFEAAERCHLNLEFLNYSKKPLITPSVVNYCFANEIILKLITSLFKDSKKIKKTHDIVDLFKELIKKDLNFKNFIEKSYNIEYLEKCLDSFRLEKIDGNGHISPYQSWRYSYEYKNKSIQIAILRDLFVICLDFIHYQYDRFMPEFGPTLQSFQAYKNWSTDLHGKIVLLDAES